MIQPPGEPREQHLGEVWKKVWATYTKFHKRRNDWKSRYMYIGAFLGLFFIRLLSSKISQVSKIKNLKKKIKIFGNYYISFFFLFLFPKLNKWNISLIYKVIILIFFSESSYGKYLQVLKNQILIQPSGEPQEQHLGDVRPKKIELHKIS